MLMYTVQVPVDFEQEVIFVETTELIVAVIPCPSNLYMQHDTNVE